MRSIPADTVVIAVGLKARQSLYEELLADGKKAYLIGDAVKPGKIFERVPHGVQAGGEDPEGHSHRIGNH